LYLDNFIPDLVKFIENDKQLQVEGQLITDFLSSPFKTSLTSIKEQLIFIKDHWEEILGKDFIEVVSALDLISEEEKFIKMGGLGPGPTQVLDFSGISDSDYEAFTLDSDWMPNVVLLAKTAYVWLNQLSKKYNKSITRLDQIPNEELDEISSRGFNALWLIGVWERSQASKKIKHLCGSLHAEASAYSIYNYNISGDLGGEEAVRNLKHRALERGIQLAGDMVPNHVGIDSQWVRDHPDWFLQIDYTPYPSYTYNGQNLSDSSDISIYLEDHYYSKSDAAVAFKRVDNHSGETKFIYHGNDGTSMPWNDTAQLNYLNREVRDAVKESILKVADLFPIIRFDAAMVLTRRNFQRLWFPEPGSGGAIPSRSEQSISSSDFNSAMPNEFWREVVDMIKDKKPNTLLLAEAFWLLEGYFVRTLGMHRVYNSAFMNMLKSEENEKFRQSIINTIEYNPEILKRFVNFMNNPDEDTAFAQFGKEDKYFGTCVLLSTLPGLPMFGHGQIEGFTEKYGMEFRNPFHDEIPDQGFIEYHNKVIFPLLRKRYLFSEVKNFVFYDAINEHNETNNNVIAYSNRVGEEKVLVIYNNKYDTITSRIRNSWNNNSSIASAFELSNDNKAFTIFYDQITGLEYLRKNSELQELGLTVFLKGFGYHVFFNFHQVIDNENKDYEKLQAELNGRGVKSISVLIEAKKLKEKKESSITNKKTSNPLKK
jgi:glycosidase